MVLNSVQINDEKLFIVFVLAGQSKAFHNIMAKNTVIVATVSRLRVCVISSGMHGE